MVMGEKKKGRRNGRGLRRGEEDGKTHRKRKRRQEGRRWGGSDHRSYRAKRIQGPHGLFSTFISAGGFSLSNRHEFLYQQVSQRGSRTRLKGQTSVLSLSEGFKEGRTMVAMLFLYFLYRLSRRYVISLFPYSR